MGQKTIKDIMSLENESYYGANQMVPSVKKRTIYETRRGFSKRERSRRNTKRDLTDR